jgi:hypothetical protein
VWFVRKRFDCHAYYRDGHGKAGSDLGQSEGAALWISHIILHAADAFASSLSLMTWAI